MLSEHVGTLHLSGVHAFLFPAPLYTTLGMVSLFLSVIRLGQSQLCLSDPDNIHRDKVNFI
jgi:hypothetical protein